uniref:Putative ovule protein n=1 Tax=Solanum chacoense TaxID=4108 RepID=A0A0V0GL64_SOLCH
MLLFIVRTPFTISYKLQYTDYIAHIKQYKTLLYLHMQLNYFLSRINDPIFRTNHSLSRMRQVHRTEYIFQYIITNICIGTV